MIEKFIEYIEDKNAEFDYVWNVMDNKTKEILIKYEESLEKASSLVNKEYTFDKKVETQTKKDINRINRTGHI